MKEDLEGRVKPGTEGKEKREEKRTGGREGPAGEGTGEVRDQIETQDTKKVVRFLRWGNFAALPLWGLTPPSIQ